MTEMAPFITRVEYNEDGTLDEFVTGPVDSVHLEQMTDSFWYLGIYTEDGYQQVLLQSSEPIIANAGGSKREKKDVN